MQRSFGILYLGRDAGQQEHAYEQESEACNTAILALNQPDAFELARTTTTTVLERLVEIAKGYAQDDGEASWDLTVDVRELLEPLLAQFCEEWFGPQYRRGLLLPRRLSLGLEARRAAQLSRPFPFTLALHLPAPSKSGSDGDRLRAWRGGTQRHDRFPQPVRGNDPCTCHAGCSQLATGRR